MSKYRFKTEQEFREQSRWNINSNVPNGWNSGKGMNHYMGQDIPDKYNDRCDESKDFDMNDWCFDRRDYVLKTDTGDIQYDIY